MKQAMFTETRPFRRQISIFLIISIFEAYIPGVTKHFARGLQYCSGQLDNNANAKYTQNLIHDLTKQKVKQ